MSSLQRRVGMLILIALVISPLFVFAQDNSTITAVGSGIPAPLLQAFASAANTKLTMNVTGTNDGFAMFCAGKADINTATRSISIGEEQACDGASVSFLEFVVGYDIMAVVANPSTDFGQCLTSAQLNTLFAPSSTVTNWKDIASGNADIPLSFYAPPDDTTPFALLDSVVEGVGLRSDVNRVADDAAVISAVNSTSGALGVVTLPDAQAAGDKVKTLQLNTTTTGCADPSAANAEGRTYTAAYPLYVYLNAANVAKVKPILDAAFSASAAATVAAQGMTAPTDTTYTTDQQVLANNKTGRQFSKDVTAFAIPQNLVGTLNIAGSATGADYMTAITGDFVKAYAGVTLNLKPNGEPDGVRGLCNGEADFIIAFGDLTSDQAANCAANNIPVEKITLGYEAVVLVGNGDFLACLTPDQITKVWGAASEKTVTNWNQVDSSFSDLAITLLAPTPGNRYADLLMLKASGSGLPTREDVAETKDDPAYRAAAVHNVSGAMTFMSWNEYQALSADVQASAKLVAVKAGSSCVTPSEQTFADGTYTLSRPLLLLVNRLSMARQEVQSMLWYIASDANYHYLADNGYTGVSFSTLPDLRDYLQKTYVVAAQDAAQAALRAAQATPEATGQATSQAASSATSQPTSQPTSEATAPSGG